jgi:hypothetical protein
MVPIIIGYLDGGMEVKSSYFEVGFLEMETFQQTITLMYIQEQELVNVKNF